MFEFGFALFIHEQSPGAAEKPIDAFDAFGAPRLAVLQRAHEHFVEAEGVGAVFLQNVVGVDDVAAGFGHLLAVFAEDDALIDQFEKRFGGGDEAEIEEDFVPETGIQEMQDGVFGAADVEVNAGGGACCVFRVS